MSFFVKDAFAMQPPPGADPTTFDNIMSFAPLLVLMVIFYFFLIRPQQKRQNEVKEMIANLEEGEKILTQGGIYGTIQKIKEDELTIQVAPEVNIKINRHYVASVVKKPV